MRQKLQRKPEKPTKQNEKGKQVNKQALKQALKPLIKECIKEVIFEEGILSGIISEVVQGLGAQTLVEAQHEEVPQPTAQRQALPAPKQDLTETKKRMLDAIGNSSYGGVNLFENTAPLATAGSPEAPATDHGPMRDMDPHDPGVDIGGIMNLAGGPWEQIR